MINEKIEQAVAILAEHDIDMWLTFVRESTSTPDPMLETILGGNVTWASAFIITKAGKKIAIVGSMDVQNVKDHADYEVIGYRDSIKEPLLNILKENDPGRIAINFSTNDVIADGLTHGMYLMLNDYLKDSPFSDRLVSSEGIIAAVRGRKSESEVKRIKAAIDETLDIYDQVTGFLQIGKSERDVADFILAKMRAKGLQTAWDPDHCPAVFTGPDTAGAHAGPTERKIKAGHLLNIDFGVKKDDYVSDLQRTWYILAPGESNAPDMVMHGFETIRDAIQEAAKALKPGVEGWSVDAVARQYIVDAGYDEYPHALGHQVGRKAHDGSGLLCPKWDRYKNLPYSIVEKGQVFTIEPRLTVAGHGIATIEEIVQVTDDGCIFLSEPQKELILIG
ncbi:M24 family metallopeptidase [candidate division KSB1 bacterium]|nr:M24 family metallopeptidase [candidate division KSB1 bacterium]